MIVKGIAFVGGAMFGAYQSGIAQWANEGAWPSSINWHNIISGVGVSACSALGAYLSGSVTSWRSARNGKPEVPETKINV